MGGVDEGPDTSVSLVECVARAIAAAAGDNPDERTGSLLNEDMRRWEEYVGHARAAIAAMRTPTDEMLEATGDGECRKWAPGAWETMMDAALSQESAKRERSDYKHTAYGGYVDETGALKIGEIPEGER